MGLPAQGMTFSPRGLYDALDGSTAPEGACFILQNLMHDISTIGIWVPRVAAISATTFSGLNTPSAVSVMLGVGTKIYGLIASARNAGKDEPFVFDTASLAFLPVSGITNATTPTTQATTGDWTPPTMDQVGERIMVTHPGFAGGSVVVGWFDISGASISFTATTHTGSPTLDTLSIAPPSAGIEIGQQLSGTGIQAGTYVVNFDATTITMSANLIAAGQVGVAVTSAGGTLANPMWAAGQTSPVALPGVPVAVQEFSGRAWYAYKNELWFSDALQPTKMTNATQALFLGDSSIPITALGGLPLGQTTGGILSALIAFTKASGYYQVTGDTSTTNLLLNGPIGNVGCAAPRSVQLTPAGLFFMGNDGIHLIDATGFLTPQPLPGVREPFGSAQDFAPTRAAAAFNNTVYRISCTCVPNPIVGSQGAVEYWYDFEINEWSGPHSFPFNIIVPMGATFFGASNAHPAQLFQSDTFTSSTSSYSELGAPMLYQLTSALFAEDDSMSAKNVIESTVNLAIGSQSAPVVVQIVNENIRVIRQAIVQAILGNTTWGSFTWGAASWAGQIYGLTSWNVDWPDIVVYKRGAVSVSGQSFGGLRIGSFWRRVEKLGYMNIQDPP